MGIRCILLGPSMTNASIMTLRLCHQRIYVVYKQHSHVTFQYFSKKYSNASKSMSTVYHMPPSHSTIVFFPIRTLPWNGSPDSSISGSRPLVNGSPSTRTATAATPCTPARAPCEPKMTFDTKLLNSRSRPGSTSSGMSTISADTATVDPAPGALTTARHSAGIQSSGTI